MSPASQGSLEVERYIGSCLISARSNNNSSKNSGPANNHHHHHQHQQQQHHQHHANYKNNNNNNNNKKVDGNNVNVRGGRLQSRPLLGGCPHHQGYPPSPGQMVAMCECARYGSPGQHNGGTPGGSWAGMPLISMANNSRRNRKPIAHGVPRNNNNDNSMNTRPSPPPSNIDGDPNMRTPLSRLAIHTQGAPLILTGNYNARKNNNNNNNSGVHRGGPGRQFKGDQQHVQQVRRCNSEVPRDMRGGSNGNGSNGNGSSNNNTPNSDCLSVASDESSGHSENSLPRIIKPRKRRKKDRKPPASGTNVGAAETEASNDNAAETSGIVTLKPYVPLCRELYDNHRGGGGRRREEGEVRRMPTEHRPEDDARTTPCTKDDAQDVKVCSGGNGVDAGDAPLNTLFPYPCVPSTCQCRYCDPAGQIWDVDQHCYSPFLTPPSLNLSYPLFLTPPPEVKTFDFFNKDFKDSSSHVTDVDHKEVVRRSWSEPSASYNDNDEDSRRSLNEFGVIGGGRTQCDGASRRHMSTSSDASTHSSTSLSLEVSSEIVTSLNGHRDLEIKFFSSSPPSVMVDVFDFGGCDSAERWRGGSDSGEQQELWNGSRLEGPVFQEDLNRTSLMGKGVWGNGDASVEDVDGDKTWGHTWETAEAGSNECSSKRLSEEVNLLCLQNVEE